MEPKENKGQSHITSSKKRTKKKKKRKVNSQAKEGIKPPHVVIECKRRVVCLKPP